MCIDATDVFFLLWCTHARKLTKADTSKPDGIVVPRISGVFFFFLPVEGDPVSVGNPGVSVLVVVVVVVVASSHFPDVHKYELPVTLISYDFPS